MHPDGLILATYAYFVLLTTVENTHFGHNDLFNLFKLMNKIGQSHLDELKSDANARHVREESEQFLVVTVLSEREIMQSKHWTNLQDIDNSNRLKIYINKLNPGCNLQLGPKPLHGEIMCLYSSSTEGLSTMLAVFKESHDKEWPNVVLYSHYIPCADVSGIPYSCSEELGKEALGNKDTYRMLVGFEKFYPKTNLEKAKEFMCRGNIGLFQLVQNSLKSLYYLNSPPNMIDVMFQDTLFECLIDIDVQQCCKNANPRECQHICLERQYLILYIDDLCYNVVKEHDNLRGQLTEISKGIFLETAKKYIGQRLDPVCRKCLYPERVTHAIEFCVVGSLDKATYIGAKGSTSSPWKRPPVNNIHWHRLYPENPPVCSFPLQYCKLNNLRKCQGGSRFERRNKMRLAQVVQERFENYNNKTWRPRPIS